MVSELITLPVRIGVRATRLWLRAAEETVNLAANATGRLITRASRGAGGSSGPSPSPPQRNRRDAAADHPPRRDEAGPAEKTSAPPQPATRTMSPRTPPPIDLESPAEPEPAHVSEEPALVEEFAEPGAEDGAGAQIHIEAPWGGYGEMNAKQIVARLGSATPAELAAVQLYENSHRGRQTILNAVQRELRSANGGSSGSQQRG